MTNEKLNDAIIEAERFIKAAQKAQLRLFYVSTAKYGCKETASARRASMDLTRSLSELRSNEQSNSNMKQ